MQRYALLRTSILLAPTIYFSVNIDRCPLFVEEDQKRAYKETCGKLQHGGQVMLYVERDKDGKIIALHNRSGPNADEQKSIMDEEIVDFLNKNVDTEPWIQFLSLSDTGIIRILEDLIDLLIRKNVILFTELPEDAQIKIRERKRVRETMTPENLMVDDIL
jgi:hypothetical protein